MFYHIAIAKTINAPAGSESSCTIFVNSLLITYDTTSHKIHSFG